MEKNTKGKATNKKATTSSKNTTTKKNIIIDEPKVEVKEVKEIKKSNKNEGLIKKVEMLDENRKAIYGFIIGLLLGLLILVIVYPERIAKLKDGTEPVVSYKGTTITADDLYDEMKDYYSISKLVDMIDDQVLTKMYPENDEMKESIKNSYDQYINYYSSAGYTEEQFLSGSGFASKDDFIKVLTLDYRRNLYLDEYIKKNTTDEEIDKYYKENVFGDIDSKHMLVKVDTTGNDGLSSDDAKKLAKEIISKLDEGKTFDEVKEEYKDSVTYEELGYQAFNATLEESYMNALKELKNGTYTKEPVETSYGFHIIYRIDQKEKAELKDVKDAIIEGIITTKKSEDDKLLYKALISLRNDKKLEFSDSILKEKYNVYCKSYK